MSLNLPLEVTRENKRLTFRGVTAYILGQVRYSTPCCPTKEKLLLQIRQYAFEQNSIPYKKQ